MSVVGSNATRFLLHNTKPEELDALAITLRSEGPLFFLDGEVLPLRSFVMFQSELMLLYTAQLRLLRNFFFALNGYQFRSADLRD